MEFITNFQSPVELDEFRDFIKVSRTGAITHLEPKQVEQLLECQEGKSVAARVLKCSRATVNKMIEDGRLVA